VKKFALASGITGALVYISCIILMSVLPKETLIKLANLIFHGIDFSKIIRMDIPVREILIGVVASFFLWGVIGYLLAFIYKKLN
jgi:hypothetical protein